MSGPQTPSPYIGLRPFESHESHLFFGRGDQIDGMLQRIEAGRFLAVIGASGCGKSSLVRAGLLPAVAHGFVMNQPEDWLFVNMRPGDNPFRAMAEAIQRRETGEQLISAEDHDPPIDAERTATIERALRGGRRSLLRVVTDAVGDTTTPVLLLVDQFEELFRFRDESLRSESASSFEMRDDALAFVDLLLATVEDTRLGDQKPPVFVVITMRSDFLGHCEAFTGLPEKISECQFLAPRMTRNQLEEAIVEPLRSYASQATDSESIHQVTMPQPSFVNRVLNDVGTDPDLLPLMQHALRRTWEQAVLRCKDADSVELTKDDYDHDDVGGFAHALDRHATEIYDQLGSRPEQAERSSGSEHDNAGTARSLFRPTTDPARKQRLQTCCQRMFCALSERRDDGPLIRRPCSIQQIVEETGQTAVDVQAVADAFVAANLLVYSPKLTSGEEPTAETRVDISHESLLRQWNKLSGGDESPSNKTSSAPGWLDAERDDVMKYRQLATFADQHQADSRFVVSGIAWETLDDWWTERDPHRGWADRHISQSWKNVARLRKASAKHADDEARAKQTVADQKERDRQRRLRTFRNWLLVMGLALTVISGLGIFAVKKAREADAASEIAKQRAQEATASATEATGNRTTAQLLLADFANRDENDREKLFWLWRALDEMNPDDSKRRGVLEKTAIEASFISPIWLHHGGVRAVAFSQDGKTVLTGGEDNTARLWDVQTGEPKTKAMKHQGDISAVAFSPDGKTVLTGTSGLYNGMVWLWDARSGKLKAKPMRHQEGNVVAVAFSPDGKTVLTGSSSGVASDTGTARLWDAQTGESRADAMEHKGDVNAVAFSPDGKTILTGSGSRFAGTARLWDAQNGEPKADAMKHQGSVGAVAFSPNGKTVLTGSDDHTARLWDAQTGEPKTEAMQHEGSVRAVAFSPNGKTVLTGSDDHTARLWDAQTGEPKADAMKHQDSVRAVAFSPNGKTALTGSDDHTARLWDGQTGEPKANAMEHQGPVRAVAFSPNGTKILVGGSLRSPSKCYVYVHFGVRTLKHDEAVNAVAFSPDGTTVLTGSGEVHSEDTGSARLWDARTGEPKANAMKHQDDVNAVAFSPDGKTVLTGSGNVYARTGTAQLWDAQTGKPKAEAMIHHGGGGVNAVAFSPDGKTVLTGSGSGLVGTTAGTARLWDAETGEPKAEAMKHPGGVRVMALSPDGKTVLTGGYDGTARLWDAQSGKLKAKPMGHQEGNIVAVAFSPDGKTALTGSATVIANVTQTARLWDAQTGEPKAKAMNHQGGVNAVAFSPDGKTVLTGSSDDTARLWDAQTGEPKTKSMKHQGSVRAVAFSPDGKTVLTGSDDKTARLWDAQTGEPKADAMKHQKSVRAVAFSPDGKTGITGSGNSFDLFNWSKGTARVWDIPPPCVDPRIARDRLRLSIEARTGLARDKNDSRGFHELTVLEAYARHRQIQEEFDGKPGDVRSWDEYYAEHPEEMPENIKQQRRNNQQSNSKTASTTDKLLVGESNATERKGKSSPVLPIAFAVILLLAVLTVVASIRNAKENSSR